ADNIDFPCKLLGKTVISKYDKRKKRAGKSIAICAENNILDRSTLTNHTNEEGRCHTPGHPICPVENSPVLDKSTSTITRSTQRIHPSRKPDKVLRQIANRCNTGLNNISCLSPR